MSIYKSLSKFHEEVGKVTKDSTNPHFKSKYADIDTVLDAIREPLKKAGLCFTQLPQQGGLKTIIATIDGDDKIEGFCEYNLSKNDMQGLGSAITYARRYSLVSMLGLEAEDDDGNASVKPKEQPKQEDEALKTKKYVDLVKMVMKEFKLEKKDAQDIINACGVKFELQSIETALNDIGGFFALIENKLRGEQ